MHPQFEGIIIISRLLVEYDILPSLGMRDVDKAEDPKEVINEDNVINEEGVEEKALPVVEEIGLNEEDVKKEEESTVVETNEETEDFTISDIPDHYSFYKNYFVMIEDPSGSDFSYTDNSTSTSRTSSTKTSTFSSNIAVRRSKRLAARAARQP